MSRPNRRDFDRATTSLRLGGTEVLFSDGLSEPMAGEESYPRRKRAEPARTVKSAPAKPLRRTEGEALRAASREALDVARYIADMTAQLEAMANAAHLDLLAYFLGMAKAESEMFVRTNTLSADELDDEPAAASEAG